MFYGRRRERRGNAEEDMKRLLDFSAFLCVSAMKALFSQPQQTRHHFTQVLS
jgi:hypothetical protein